MVFITKPDEEGETTKCQNCDVDLIARWTDYKGRYEDKLQWQTLEPRKAHYDKEGNCNTDEKPKTFAEQQETAQNTTKLPILTSEDFKTVHDESKFILQIRKVIQDTVKESEIDPHPGMIWEMTALIFKKYYGVKK